jgi:uncharacterized protein YegL
MPSDRVSSASPWHVVFIIDDSGSMGVAQGASSQVPAQQVNDALKAMVSEMEVIAKGTKPYFKISIVAFGSSAEIIVEAMSERDIEIDNVATFSGSHGTTRCSQAFRQAADLLRRNPGAATDFRPYVFFFSDGRPDSDDHAAAVQAASDLKAIDIPAGQPAVWAFGYGDLDSGFMKQICSNSEYFKELPDASALTKLFPAIGTIAGTKTGESAINTAIINL